MKTEFSLSAAACLRTMSIRTSTCLKGKDFFYIQYIRYVPVGDFPRLTNWTQEVVPGATNIVGN